MYNHHKLNINQSHHTLKQRHVSKPGYVHLLSSELENATAAQFMCYNHLE